MIPLGTHVGCGGEVIVVVRPTRGYRYCVECCKRGVDVSLVEEQPETKPTEKVTLSRKVRMFQYASRLKIGHIITPEEEAAIDDCAIYAQMAFAHYGIDIKQTPFGWQVVKRLEVE